MLFRSLRSSLEHIAPDPTCIDMNPFRREVNEFWDHLKTVESLGGLQIRGDYSQRHEEFTDCITYLGNHLRPREKNMNALDIDYDYEHCKLSEEIQGILDKLSEMRTEANVSMYLFSASLLYKLLPIR